MSAIATSAATARPCGVRYPVDLEGYGAIVCTLPHDHASEHADESRTEAFLWAASPIECAVRPEVMAGHGPTGRWAWAVEQGLATRPRVRYGTEATEDRAWEAASAALASL